MQRIARQQRRRPRRQQLVHQRLTADQLGKGGQGLHLKAQAFQLFRQIGLLVFRQRRHRKDHAVQLVQILHPFGMHAGVNRQATDVQPAQGRVVIEEGIGNDVGLGLQRRCQRHAGASGAIDRHPRHRARPAIDRQQHLQKRQPRAREHGKINQRKDDMKRHRKRLAPKRPKRR